MEHVCQNPLVCEVCIERANFEREIQAAIQPALPHFDMRQSRRKRTPAPPVPRPRSTEEILRFIRITDPAALPEILVTAAEAALAAGVSLEPIHKAIREAFIALAPSFRWNMPTGFSRPELVGRIAALLPARKPRARARQQEA